MIYKEKQTSIALTAAAETWMKLFFIDIRQAYSLTMQSYIVEHICI